MQNNDHGAFVTTAAAASARPALLAPVDSAPAADYDVALLDLDGVVYTGPAAVPGAAQALADARAAGMRPFVMDPFELHRDADYDRTGSLAELSTIIAP